MTIKEILEYRDMLETNGRIVHGTMESMVALKDANVSTVSYANEITFNRLVGGLMFSSDEAQYADDKSNNFKEASR